MGKSEYGERRALSAAGGLWQSWRSNGSGLIMLRTPLLVLALLGAPATAQPLSAVPGGDLGTLQLGSYACELPGDATGPAATPVPAEGFTVINASSYQAAGGRGSYLRTGSRVTMTSGPKRGQQFHRISAGFLRKIGPDGADSDLRCVRTTRNTGRETDIKAD